MNQHPYDNRERRYRHSDPDRSMGIDLIAKLLRVRRSAMLETAHYDLSFYSGGIGIIDRLAVVLPADDDSIAEVLRGLVAKTPEELAIDPIWSEDFLWLIHDDEQASSPRAEAVRFINASRHAFQPVCERDHAIWFAVGSGVNDWYGLWKTATSFNYLGYSQE